MSRGPRVVVSTAAFYARARGSFPGLGGFKETKMFLPHPLVKLSLHDREVACSASGRQGMNFESCFWRAVSSHSSHHPQDVLLAQFSLYVHKCGLMLDSFHFIYMIVSRCGQDWNLDLYISSDLRKEKLPDWLFCYLRLLADSRRIILNPLSFHIT